MNNFYTSIKRLEVIDPKTLKDTFYSKIELTYSVYMQSNKYIKNTVNKQFMHPFSMSVSKFIHSIKFSLTAFKNVRRDLNLFMSSTFIHFHFVYETRLCLMTTWLTGKSDFGKQKFLNGLMPRNANLRCIFLCYLYLHRIIMKVCIKQNCDFL